MVDDESETSDSCDGVIGAQGVDTQYNESSDDQGSTVVRTEFMK